MKPGIESQRSRDGRSSGIARTDLIAGLAASVLLAGMVAPAMGTASARSRTQLCLDNLQALMRATQLYAADHRDEFPMGIHGGAAQAAAQIDYTSASSLRPWVTGWMTFDTSPANTNTLFLVDSRYTVLGSYTRDPRLYKCPADTAINAPQRSRGWSARVRSYSGNGAVGGGNKMANDGLLNAEKLFIRTTDVDRPAPSNLFVYLEEQAASINDGFFANAQMDRRWIDLPANVHRAVGTNTSANFVFADGHGETHVWTASMLGVRSQFTFSPPPVRSGDVDWGWVLDRTSYHPRAVR